MADISISASVAPRNKLTLEQKLKIAAEYDSGSKYREICERWGIGGGTVWHITKEFSRSQRHPRLTDQERLDLASKYESGIRIAELAREYGLAASAAKNIVINHGKFTSGRDKIKHLHDNHAFSQITPNSAYWIGFLMADGSIWGNNLTLRLATRDIGHVEKFRRFLKSTHAITIEPPKDNLPPRNGLPVRSSGAGVFTIRSPQIISDIANYGVVRNKSKTAQAEGGIENNPHFWRGAVDGDGWVTFAKNTKRPLPSIGICGSANITRQFCEFVSATLDCPIPRIEKKGELSYVRLAGHLSALLSEILYDNDYDSLDRKKETARMMFGFKFLHKSNHIRTRCNKS